MYGYDVFTIRQLLEASGVADLDAMGAATLRGAPTSYRYEGITIYLQINYNNMQTFGFSTSEPEYHYKALLMSTYKPSHDAIQPQYFGPRTVLNRHGITIVGQASARRGLTGATSAAALGSARLGSARLGSALKPSASARSFK